MILNAYIARWQAAGLNELQSCFSVHAYRGLEGVIIQVERGHFHQDKLLLCRTGHIAFTAQGELKIDFNH